MKTLIQVGANDGSDQDDIVGQKILEGWTGILVEPIPYYFARLVKNYSDYKNVYCENIAISTESGKRKIYYVDLDFIKNNPVPSWMGLLGSFDLRTFNEYHFEGKQLPVVSQEVNCLTLTQLVKNYGLYELDLLVIDTEGHDFDVIKSLDMSVLKPARIIYETKHMPYLANVQCLQYLNRYGYSVCYYIDNFGNPSAEAILEKA